MRNAVVFGANSEIAVATIKLLAERNYNLFLCGRNLAELELLKTDLMVKHPDLSIECASFEANAESWPELLDQIQQKFSQLHLVFIAYGTLPNQIICQSSWGDTQAALQINGLSVINLCHHFANILEAQGQGTLLVISSVAGDRGRQSNYVYGTAKAMLSHYLQGLRNRLSRHNVQVITLKPGFVITKMTESFERKGLLWVPPERVAMDILKALDKKRDVIYTPWFWLPIMLIIKLIPERIFKKMKL